MAVLQRSTKVKMPVDKAEKCWNDFASQNQNAPKSSSGNGGGQGGNGKDPGTVYFTKVDDGTTEVTIQLDPDGIATGDESQMNQRVDSFLERFKGFVEQR
jgi:hypothetical protein